MVSRSSIGFANPACLAILAAALALAGCERGRDPEPAPSAAPTSSAAKPASIIRPDIEVVEEADPLVPLETQIGFPGGGADLDKAAEDRLAAVLSSPQLAAGGGIVLRGHSDSAGDDAANLRVSKARAEAVRDWLVERGVDEGRIWVIAMGDQNPIAANGLPDGAPDERGRARNRRVDLTIEVPQRAPATPSPEKPKTLAEELSR